MSDNLVGHLSDNLVGHLSNNFKTKLCVRPECLIVGTLGGICINNINFNIKYKINMPVIKMFIELSDGCLNDKLQFDEMITIALYYINKLTWILKLLVY